jgi:hypothetical protein
VLMDMMASRDTPYDELQVGKGVFGVSDLRTGAEKAKARIPNSSSLHFLITCLLEPL